MLSYLINYYKTLDFYNTWKEDKFYLCITIILHIVFVEIVE